MYFFSFWRFKFVFNASSPRILLRRRYSEILVTCTGDTSFKNIFNNLQNQDGRLRENNGPWYSSHFSLILLRYARIFHRSHVYSSLVRFGQQVQFWLGSTRLYVSLGLPNLCYINVRHWKNVLITSHESTLSSPWARLPIVDIHLGVHNGVFAAPICRVSLGLPWLYNVPRDGSDYLWLCAVMVHRDHYSGNHIHQACSLVAIPKAEGLLNLLKSLV